MTSTDDIDITYRQQQLRAWRCDWVRAWIWEDTRRLLERAEANDSRAPRKRDAGRAVRSRRDLT